MAKLIPVMCCKCKRIFLRYDPSTAKKRVHKPHRHSHHRFHRRGSRSLLLTASCMLCRGAVQILAH